MGALGQPTEWTRAEGTSTDRPTLETTPATTATESRITIRLILAAATCEQ